MTNVSVKIGPEPISLEALVQFATLPECGAVATFLGTVRNENEGHPVSQIHYTAFQELAEKECAKIAAAALERWPVKRVAIQHRLGMLTPPEASIAIAVSSPHRADALEACRYLIEEIKKTVPIWKEEFTDEGKIWINS